MANSINNHDKIRKFPISELREGMENWNGKVYFGEGEPTITNGIATVCYALDDEEYPLLNFVNYDEDELVEVWS